MDVKKSSEANVDNLRLPIIAIGFLFIGSLTLASFSYTTGVEKEGLVKKEKKNVKEEVEEEVKKEDEPKVETPPAQIDAPPPVAEDIVQKENEDDVPITTTVVVPPVPVGEITLPPPTLEAEVIDFPDVEAEFPGGTAEMKKWISSNIEYPQMAIENGDEGKVFVAFVVEPDGSITNVTIERGVTDELDAEAKRMMREMPKWGAGEKDGKKVRTKVRLPIAFTLN